MELLAQLREAFNQPTMTEGEAFSKIQNLITNSNKNTENTQKLTDLQTQLTAKNEEILSLKSKIPVKLEDNIATKHIDLVCREAKVLASEGKMTPAQADALVSTFKPEGKAKLEYVGSDGTVSVPFEKLVETFSLNKSMPIGKESTAAQREIRTIPGKESNGEEKILTKEEKAELIALANMSL